MKARALATSLLKCGYLDTDYLLDLLDAYKLDPDELVSEVESYRGETTPTVNDLISVALDSVARSFLAHVVK